MKHLGDISKIDWSKAEPVFCVTGGSPCQDLSVAGKRAGLAGERSGLYMEQIRCIRELRKEDEKRGRTGKLVRPRYMVWENVPGAFSSNKGKDFAAVLEEAIKIVCPNCPPVPVPDGGWPYCGSIRDGVGGRWSVAWRTHDAQYWGVPQRRRRVSLVCDFGGDSAAEVLFECKSVSGNPAQSRTPWKETSKRFGAGVAGTSETCEAGRESRRESNEQGLYSANEKRMRRGREGHLIQAEKSGTLAVSDEQILFAHEDATAYNGVCITSPLNQTTPAPGDPCHTLTNDGRNYVVYENEKSDSIYRTTAQQGSAEKTSVYSVENHPNDSRVKITDSGIVQSLTSRMGTGGATRL